MALHRIAIKLSGLREQPQGELFRIGFQLNNGEKFVEKLTGFQKRYLKGLAHGLKPLVFIGQKGPSPQLFEALNEALEIHELVKVKFLEFKEKETKSQIAEVLEKETASALIGIVGHMAVFFRRQADPERRKISLPN